MGRTVSQRDQARPRSRHDQRSHLLTERGPDQIGVLVAVCGRRMPWPVGTSAQLTVRQPPDSGRPPVEQFPRPIPAPGGRPDPTTPVGSAANTDQVVINPCMQLPATSVDPVSGPGLELVASLVLPRGHGGG
jgi:hypothetical protein